MRVIEFFTAENKEHWLEELKKCDWDAGQHLHHLLKGNELKKMVGETALVPMLVDEERLVSFCTFAPLDDIQPTELTPWVGFVYTFPATIAFQGSGAEAVVLCLAVVPTVPMWEPANAQISGAVKKRAWVVAMSAMRL